VTFISQNYAVSDHVDMQGDVNSNDRGGIMSMEHDLFGQLS